MSIRRLSTLAAVLVAAAALGGTLTPVAGAADAPIRIGLEGPLSGDQKAIGTGMLKGAQLAASQVNARGGIGGRKVEIVAIDDAADPKVGVAAAKKAIARGLDGVVGPYNSGVGAETLPLYISAGLVPIRLTSADSTNGLGLTLQPMTYQIAPVAADALTTWLGARTVGIIYDDTTLYTQTVAAALQSELQSAGVTITAFAPIEPGAKSYTSTIDQVAATKPDVIYLAAYYPEAGLMAKEMQAAKVSAQCLADYGAYSTGFIETAGKKAAQACPVVGVPAPNEFSGAKRYVAAYAKKFGDAPGVWSPYTYDSVNFLLAGVKEVGGFTTAALSSALTQLTGFSGWTGPVTIDPATGNREPATVVVLETDKAGEFRIDQDWATAVGAQV
ncbi:MAG: branched-chain amino acid ABC transporter substrate-binding protein [Actinomycetota bacterium]